VRTDSSSGYYDRIQGDDFNGLFHGYPE
jgi:hypothetical protein